MQIEDEFLKYVSLQELYTVPSYLDAFDPQVLGVGVREPKRIHF